MLLAGKPVYVVAGHYGMWNIGPRPILCLTDENSEAQRRKAPEGRSLENLSKPPISESVLQVGPYIHLRVQVSGSMSLRGIITNMYMSVNRHRMYPAAD